MSYNKKQHYRDNIEAIKVALSLDKEPIVQASHEAKEVLKKYSGFGGLKCVLNNDFDPNDWPEYDRDLIPLQKELFDVLRHNSYDDDPAYYNSNRYLGSIRNSVLSGFYTPHEVVEAIAEAVKDSGIKIETMLEPSAGSGIFVDAFNSNFDIKEGVAIEKDLLTGKILKHLHSSEKQEVLVQGLEQLPSKYENHFDLVVSNIPFGDFGVFDEKLMNTPERKLATKTIHNYFFVKGLDAARESGLVAFITSQGVANSPNNRPIREYLMNHADLISAIRLPNNLFTDNVGTQVGTDLIILQKNSNKTELSKEEKLFVETTTIGDNSIKRNAYIDEKQALFTQVSFGKDPYGKPAIIFEYRDDFSKLKEDLQSKLSADFVKLKPLASIVQKKQTTENKNFNRQTVEKQPKNVQLELDFLNESNSAPQIAQPIIQPLLPSYTFTGVLPHHREGSLAVMTIEGHGTILGTLSNIIRDNKKANFDVINDKRTLKQQPFFERYIELRDTYEDLYLTEADSLAENPEKREKLNAVYDRFVADFGHIKRRKNLIKTDSTFLAVLSLEKMENGELKKADIFFEPTAFNSKPLEEVENAQDALITSLNQYGYPHLPFMARIFPQQDIAATIDELVKSNMLYYDAPNGEYVTKDKFLSGNMYYKFDDTLKYYEKMPACVEKTYTQKGLEEIKAAIPEPIAFDNIGLQIGERWLPTALYEKFAKHLFGETTTIQYHPTIDEYVVSVSGWMQSNFSVLTASGRSDLKAQDLLKHALESTRPEITKTEYIGGKATSVPDYERQQLADLKIGQIRDAFEDYILRRLPDEEKKKLQFEYNMRFNGNIRPVFDGSHQVFPGLQLENHPQVKALYQSQKDAVWMLKQNGGGVIDHEVGGGKTFTMCIAAQEMKRTGAANLPLIIAMKANVEQIAKDYQVIYPNAKICFPSEKDYNSENRQTFFNQIRNNNWDVVIMSHDNFKAIPQDPQIELEILEERLNKLIQGDIATKNERSGTFSARERKGLQKRIENLRAKVQTRQHQTNQNKDHELTCNFSTLGFDHIFVDESHMFKNLAFETRHSRVAGLGNSEGSQKADCLLTAIRTIQKKTGKDLGATFLSGTTIANSISELYSLFNYLRPQELQRQGLSSFDAWAGTYAQKTKDFEIAVTGEIKAKERFRHFVKVPELAAFYNEITDYKSAEDIGIDRPKKNEILVALKPSEDLLEFNKNLIAFAKTGEAKLIGRDNYDNKKDKARMLIATNVAKAASLDMRLIDPEKYGDNPLNKASQVAKRIAEYYHKFDEKKGTQFVFSDLATWQNNKDWNIYSEIKRKLVEDHGIPEKEIAFIQTAKTDKKKEAMIDKMNRGEVRVIFGSTTTLGTGVNAQQRAVAIHHLDIPWRPCDLEQRNGRAVRTQNWIAKEFNKNQVDVLVYAVEQSLDPYKFNLLTNKQQFIDQLKRGKNGNRKIDEGAMDEETGINFHEYTAILSGNTDLLDKAKIERKISALESERTIFYQDAWRIEKDLSAEKSNVAKLENNIQTFLSDYGHLQNNLLALEKDEKGNVIPAFTFSDGQTTNDPKLIANKMHEFNKNADTEGRAVNVAKFLGFDVLVRTETVSTSKKSAGIFSTEKENLWAVRGVTRDANAVDGRHLTYTFNHGRIAQDPKTCAAFALNALNRIPSIIDQHKIKLQDSQTRVESLSKSVTVGTWKKEDELKNLRAERDALNLKITKEINEDVHVFSEPELVYNNNTKDLETVNAQWNKELDDFKAGIATIHGKTNNHLKETLNILNDSVIGLSNANLTTQSTNVEMVGEFSHVRRVFEESKAFDFTSGTHKIETPADVAYIFKKLEDKAIENAFAVLIKDGEPTVLHLGMGNTKSVSVDCLPIINAASKINPDEIYFVHNHPSGKLMASAEDLKLYKLLKEQLGAKLQPGIIINLTSGKFGVYDDGGYVDEISHKSGIGTEIPLKLYAFSKQVFDKDYNPKKNFKITSSLDAAQFVSSHRLGDRNKMSFLVIREDNTLVGNVFTPYTTIDRENLESIANEIVVKTSSLGGLNVIPYGTFAGVNLCNDLAASIKKKSLGAIKMLDTVYIDKQRGMYASLADNGGFLSNRPDSDNAFHALPMAAEGELGYINRKAEIEEANNRFNAELQQQIDGSLRKGHIYKLGMPSKILQSAGIPDLPIEMSARRLSDKSMQENHPFNLLQIQDLPRAIQNPMAVFRSATHIGSYVVLTEIKHNDKNFVVAIETDRKQGKIEVNSVRSVHYRNSNSHIANWINEGLAEYANKQKMIEWLSQQRYNSADVRKSFNHAAKIVKNFENPKLSEENLSEDTDIRRFQNKALTSIDPKQFKNLIEVLKKTGLAKNILTNKQAEKILGEDGTRAMMAMMELNATNARWNRELDEVSAGTHKGILHLGKPLQILQEAGIKEQEIELAKEVLEKKLKQHNLTIDDLHNLAKAIQNPIMVYEWGTKAKSTVIVTELTTKDGRKITLALRGRNKGKKLEVTEVASIHGKAAERFLSEMGNATEGGLESALRWVEKEKALDWLGLSMLSTSQGLSEPNQLEISTSMVASSKTEKDIAKILKNFENPKLSEKKFEITDKIRPMATPKGEIYGFVTPEGDVWIDENNLNANTPIHEFGHLFWSVAMPAEMKAQITALLKNTNEWQRISKNPAYANLKTDDQKADEVFNTLLGSYGESSQRVQEVIGRDIMLIARVKTALKGFWEWLKGVFNAAIGLPKQGHEYITEKDFENAKKAEQNLRMFSVWHGTAADFDRFDRSKFLSGEGAMSYGAGFYFTDKESIAKSYAGAGNAKTNAELFAKRNPEFLEFLNKLDVDEKFILHTLSNFKINNDKNISIEETKKAIENDKFMIRANIQKAEFEKALIANEAILDYLSKNELDFIEKNRFLLSVKIHGDKTVDELNFMRWDKPITEKQKQQVLQAAKKINFNDWRESEKFKEYVENGKLSTGIQIYSVLSNELGSDQAVSELLLQAGIDGIQYPTEYQSKGTHEDSYNYVVFADNAIEIAEHIRLQAQAANTLNNIEQVTLGELTALMDEVLEKLLGGKKIIKKLNEEYPHFRFKDEDGNQSAEAIPFHAPEKRFKATDENFQKNTTIKQNINLKNSKIMEKMKKQTEIDPAMQSYMAEYAATLKENRNRGSQMQDEEPKIIRIAKETNWNEFKEKTGIDVTQLDEKNIERLLDGKKTNLLVVTRDVDGSSVNVNVKLSVGWDPATEAYGKPLINYQKQSLDLEKPYFGYAFTDEDKKNLLETGNLGKPIDVAFQDGDEPKKRLVSIDFDTNEVVSKSLKLYDKFMGKDLALPENQQLKADLEDGKRIFVKDMDYGKHKIDAYVQYNAAKEGFDFDLTQKCKEAVSLNQIKNEMTRFNKKENREGYFYRNTEFSEKEVVELSKGNTLNKQFARVDGTTYYSNLRFDFENRKLEQLGNQKLKNSPVTEVKVVQQKKKGYSL